MGALISTIGKGLSAIIGATATVLIAVVELITTVLIAIVDILWDIVCCRCCGSRASESRFQTRREQRRLAAESVQAENAKPAKS